MKLYILHDERYPDHCLENRPGYMGNPPVEISEAEFADYERVCREYEMWQEKLSRLSMNDGAKP
jgi:hypothetical protein